MREGNCSVSDERTGSHGLKLRKESSALLRGNRALERTVSREAHTHGKVG